MKRFFSVLLVVAASAAFFAAPVLASAPAPLPSASPQIAFAAPDGSAPAYLGGGVQQADVPEEGGLEAIILGLVGVVMSAIFKYVPAWKAWYDGFAHQGLVMLGFVAVISGVYFGLSCTSYAEMLNISLACSEAGAVELAKVIFSVAAGNQLAFLYLPNVDKAAA